MKKNHLLLLERDKALRSIHTSIIEESGLNMKYLPREVIVKKLSKCAAPRFFIESTQARKYVTAYYYGKKLHKSRIKAQMVKDLVHVFEEVREKNIHAPMGEVWELVVEHTAPSFYLSEQRITEIIYQYHDRK